MVSYGYLCVSFRSSQVPHPLATGSWGTWQLQKVPECCLTRRSLGRLKGNSKGLSVVFLGVSWYLKGVHWISLLKVSGRCFKMTHSHPSYSKKLKMNECESKWWLNMNQSNWFFPMLQALWTHMSLMHNLTPGALKWKDIFHPWDRVCKFSQTRFPSISTSLMINPWHFSKANKPFQNAPKKLITVTGWVAWDEWKNIRCERLTINSVNIYPFQVSTLSKFLNSRQYSTLSLRNGEQQNEHTSYLSHFLHKQKNGDKTIFATKLGKSRQNRFCCKTA